MRIAPLLAAAGWLAAAVAGTWGVIELQQVQGLEATLTTSTEANTRLQHQLNDTAVKLRDADSQVSLLNARLIDAQTPELPIEVSFRRALLGPGLVAIFHNTSGSSIEAIATLLSAATGDIRRFRLVLLPGAVEQVGYAQSGAIAPGQHVRVTSAKFKPLDVVAPGQ